MSLSITFSLFISLNLFSYLFLLVRAYLCARLSFCLLVICLSISLLSLSLKPIPTGIGLAIYLPFSLIQVDDLFSINWYITLSHVCANPLELNFPLPHKLLPSSLPIYRMQRQTMSQASLKSEGTQHSTSSPPQEIFSSTKATAQRLTSYLSFTRTKLRPHKKMKPRQKMNSKAW